MNGPAALALGSTLMVVGAGAAFAPRQSARMFGVAQSGDGLAFVRATGVRDAALGFAIVTGRGDDARTTALLAITSVVAAADAAILAAARGPRPQHLIHLTGCLLFALAAALE